MVDRRFIRSLLLLILVGVTLAAGWPVYSSASPAAPTTTAVWSWGRNFRGQLGFGFNDSSPHAIPAEITALDGVITIAADDTYRLALKSDGTVWAWGDNTEGQLGAPSTDSCGGLPCSLTPVQVNGVTNAIAIAAAAFSGIALKSDGTVWSWGAGVPGPATPVAGLSGITAVAVGFDHFLALDANGPVWAWGFNGNGQLGDGTFLERHSPV